MDKTKIIFSPLRSLGPHGSYLGELGPMKIFFPWSQCLPSSWLLSEAMIITWCLSFLKNSDRIGSIYVSKINQPDLTLLNIFASL